MLHVVEAFDAAPIGISPHPDRPRVALVEDTDWSLRWLITAEPELNEHWLIKAQQAGAAGVVLLSPTARMVVTMAAYVAEARPAPRGAPWVLSTAWKDALPEGDLSTVLFTWAMTDSPEAPKTQFGHLHAHTEYSSLDGLATVKEAVGQAKADNQPFLAMTDHGSCAGHTEHQRECAAVDVKAIFGMEANFVNNRLDTTGRTNDYKHLILLAQTKEGLHNLWGASSAGFISGFHGRSRLDWDVLEKYGEGILCSTACLRGPLSDMILADDYDGAIATLARFQRIFGDRLVLELHTNTLPEQVELNKRLVQIGLERSIPFIVVADSHYGCRADHDLHRMWMAMQTNSDLDESGMFGGEQHYFVASAEEVAASIAYLGPDVVEAAMKQSVIVADSCDATIDKRYSTPIYHRKGYEDPIAQDDKTLREMCYEAFEKRCAHKPNAEVYRDRLEEELALLTRKQFSGYMLIDWDHINYAKTHGILVGPGRGSAAGSLVCWLLRITMPDPIKYNLRFGRFLTPGRTSLPDVDTDFPSSKREEMYAHAVDRWGEEYVVRVGTHTRLKSKGVIKDVARVLNGIGHQIAFTDLAECSEVITVAEAGTAGLGMSWDDLWFQFGDYQREPERGSLTLNQCRAKYPELFELCDRLVGRLKSYGRHPAGIVINPTEPIWGRLPLRRAGKEGQITTEFSMEDLEYLGYVKLDDLTLRTLDTIQLCLDLIAADPHYEGKAPNFDDWDEIEYEDPEVYEMLCSGDTLGTFQTETAEGTTLLKRFQPHTIEEIAAVLTLVRPGPRRSGLTESFIRRRVGQEAVTFAHTLLEDALGPSYGTMIYQEEIMDVCRILAGYDDDEADGVRKILGKKKVSATVVAGEKFVAAAVARGIERSVVNHLWEQMAEFAKYSFNRSHAIGYAFLTYWTAWLKKHYPAHYVTALLSTVEQNRIPEFVDMARRLGYQVLPPDVNQSGEGFAVGKDRLSVRYGFNSIKSIGDAATRAITQGQPYASWDDFMERKGKAANMGHLKTLAALGVFDSILPEGTNRAMLEAHLEEVDSGEIDRCRHLPPGALRGQRERCGFDWSSEPLVIGKSGKPLKPRPEPKSCSKACRQYEELPPGAWPERPPLTESVIRWRERRTLGVFLSSTPFDRLSDEDRALLQTGSAINEGPSRRYFSAGLIDRVKTHRTKGAGREMAFIDVMCLDERVSITVFPDTWERFRSSLKPDAFALIILDKNDRGCTLHDFAPIPESKED